MTEKEHIANAVSALGDKIAGHGDDRTANNAVRHQYRVLTDEEKAQMAALDADAKAREAALSDLERENIQGKYGGYVLFNLGASYQLTE